MIYLCIAFISLFILIYLCLKSYLVCNLTEVTRNSKYEYHINYKRHPHKIKVITQNLWCHYLVTVGPNSYERIRAFVSQVKDFDVVFLQEVFILRIGPFLFRGWASFIISEFKRYGFVYHTSFLESVPYLFGQNNGVAIFSKIPITETGTVTFKKSIFDLNRDYLNNKGFVWARIELSEQESILLLSVHMSAVDGITGCHIKKKEVHAIEKFIGEFKNDNIIIAGDFNTCPCRQKREYEKLESSLSCLVDIVSQNSLTTFYNTSCDVYETLDLVFISHPLKYSLPCTVEYLTENKQPVSDHLGVCVDILFGDDKSIS